MSSFLLSAERDKIDTTNEYGTFYRVIYEASLEGDELIACGSMDYRNSMDQDSIYISSDLKHIFKVDDNKYIRRVAKKAQIRFQRKYLLKNYNVKQMAEVLLFLQDEKIGSYEELASRADAASGKFHALSEEIRSCEKRMEEISTLRKHIINYVKTREIYVEYRKHGYSRKFFEAHREELTLHKAAKEAFSQSGLQKIPKVKELNAEYAELLARKKAAYKTGFEDKKKGDDYKPPRRNSKSKKLSSQPTDDSSKLSQQATDVAEGMRRKA